MAVGADWTGNAVVPEHHGKIWRYGLGVWSNNLVLVPVADVMRADYSKGTCRANTHSKTVHQVFWLLWRLKQFVN